MPRDFSAPATLLLAVGASMACRAQICDVQIIACYEVTTASTCTASSTNIAVVCSHEPLPRTVNRRLKSLVFTLRSNSEPPLHATRHDMQMWPGGAVDQADLHD